jgi:hypothetical protein
MSNLSQVTLEIDTNPPSKERKSDKSARGGSEATPNGTITAMPAELVD